MGDAGPNLHKGQQAHVGPQPELFVPRSGFCTLKFKVEDTALKRELLLLLTGAAAVPTNEAQANALAELEEYLNSILGKPLDWGIEFGLMYLNHRPELLDVDKISKVVEFVGQHPEVIEFDNLKPLRERLAAYVLRLEQFVANLNRLLCFLRPEQLNHPVVAPESPPAPEQNGTIDSGG